MVTTGALLGFGVMVIVAVVDAVLAPRLSIALADTV